MTRNRMMCRRAGMCTIMCAAMLGGCMRADRGAREGSNEMSQDLVHHTINYIEFTVTDMDRAKTFYGAAFGWQFNDYGPEYAGIQKQGGGEVGGMRLDTTVTRGGPLVILYSSDLEASVDAVKAAGGQIITEPFSFPGGRRFHFTDLEGNELAVWSER